jgi:hypothetical protein
MKQRGGLFANGLCNFAVRVTYPDNGNTSKRI